MDKAVSNLLIQQIRRIAAHLNLTIAETLDTMTIVENNVRLFEYRKTDNDLIVLQMSLVDILFNQST